MKHIISSIKRELVKQTNLTDALIKKTAIAQESYFNDKIESMRNIWVQDVAELTVKDRICKSLYSAYTSLCSAVDIEPQSLDEIIKEQTIKKEKVERKKRKTDSRINDSSDTSVTSTE